MTLFKVAAIVGAGLILTTAPALARLASPAAPHLVKPDSNIEQVRYHRSVLPEAIIGGVISGVLGGVIGGNCYFNDCGYGGGPYYGGGGGYYGGGGSRGGGRGGGRVRMSHAAVGGGHVGGGGRSGGRKQSSGAPVIARK